VCVQDKRSHGGINGGEYLRGSSKEDDMVHSEKMGRALMTVERMVNHNAQDDIFHDFKVRVFLFVSVAGGKGGGKIVVKAGW
jgi:hypothetical protein